MDAIQFQNPLLRTTQVREAASSEGIRARSMQEELPSLTRDEETMIQREFDPSKASMRYDRLGDTKEVNLLKGQSVDWRV